MSQTSPTASSAADADEPFGRFFLPGPTEVRPEILRAQVEPMIGHRGPAIRELMGEVQEGLKRLFRTDAPVFVSTSSATGLMEAAIRNGVRERVLCLVNGAFSERFADIARACGRRVDVMEVPWGTAHRPDAVARRLDEGRWDALTVVHSETSTGVLQPLEELAAVVVGRPDTLLLVDGVSSVGGAPVETDAWGLDFVLAGSQKALALPPGLAFGVASDAMLERAATVPDRGLYFDLLAFRDRIDGLQTPNTPALSLIYALREQLRRIAEEGLEARWARHRAMAERCWTWVGEMRQGRRTGPGGASAGIEMSVLPDEAYRSPTVSCIRLPDGIPGPDVVRGLRERGRVIGSGYGRLKADTIRIGHMGDHTVEELDALLEELADVIREVADR